LSGPPPSELLLPPVTRESSRAIRLELDVFVELFEPVVLNEVKDDTGLGST
jgi:hypothetical protein